MNISNKQNAKLSKLLERLEEKKFENNARSLIMDMLQEINEPNIEDLWIEANDKPYPISYWIFLTNDIHDQREATIIKQILFWKEFNGRSFVKFKCLQVSNTEFYNLCVKTLEPKSFPCLLISSDPFFSDYFQIGKETLYNLKTDNILGFLNSVYREIAMGTSIMDLRIKLKIGASKYVIDYSKILNLIAESKIHAAIDEIQLNLNLSSKGMENVALLKGQLIDLDDQNRKGLLNPQEYMKLKGRITNNLLELVNQLKRENSIQQ